MRAVLRRRRLLLGSRGERLDRLRSLAGDCPGNSSDHAETLRLRPIRAIRSRVVVAVPMTALYLPASYAVRTHRPELRSRRAGDDQAGLLASCPPPGAGRAALDPKD